MRMTCFHIAVLLLFISNSLCTSERSFVLVVLPDTQYYSAYFPYTFLEQSQWIVDCRTAMEIDFVSHLGDIVEHQNDSPSEWRVASSILAPIIAANIPLGLCVGNHDMGYPDEPEAKRFKYFDEWFPPSLFSNSDWYGGSSPAGTNRNSFQLLESRQGVEIVIIHIEFLDYGVFSFNTSWVDEILTNYSSRFAILVSHSATYDCFDSVQTTLTTLARTHCNVRLLLGGHFGECGGERVTFFANDCGRQTPAIVTDYQWRYAGGDGWLRYYVFTDGMETLHAHTFSTRLNRFENDTDSQFALDLTHGTLTTLETVDLSCDSKFIPPVIIGFIQMMNMTVWFFVMIVFIS